AAHPADQRSPGLSPRAGLSHAIDEDDTMSRHRRKTPPPRPAPPRIELRFDELGAIVERARQAPLSPEDHAKLKAAMDTLAFMTAELEAKRTSLERLRRWLFGAPTETTRTIVGPDAPATIEGASTEPSLSVSRPPRPGHGRLSAAAYTGADRVTISHPSLQRG